MRTASSTCWRRCWASRGRESTIRQVRATAPRRPPRMPVGYWHPWVPGAAPRWSSWIGSRQVGAMASRPESIRHRLSRRRLLPEVTQLVLQPVPGFDPVTPHRAFGDAEDLGCLRLGIAGEIAALDHPRQARADPLQVTDGIADRDAGVVVVRPRDVRCHLERVEGFVQADRRHATAPALA